MDFEVMKKYRQLFFETNWEKSYADKNPEFIYEIYKRANLLLKDQIVFTDPLDMEPSQTPYSLSKFKWNEYPAQDQEWTFMLNRQGFLTDLAISYCLTENSDYLAKYKELIFSFIRENGTPGEQKFASWRPLDTGLRLTNLMKSFTYIKVEEDFTEEELDELKESILIHMNYLEESYINKYDLSNWGVLAVSGMAAVNLLFPELVSESTHEFIWGKIEEQINLQFYQDGIHWEQSPLYHHQVITAYIYIVQLSKYLDQQLPISLAKKLEEPIISSAYYANNKDLLNPLHDSDNIDLSYVYDIYRYMGYLERKPKNQNSLLFVGSLYEENDNKESNNREFTEIFSGSESGFYAYKSDDLYFTLFNGLHGSSHGHATNGSFTLDVEGQPLIVDSGRYSYMEDPLRIQLKQEKAHNSVTLKNHPATVIKDSWSYVSLSEPMFHNHKLTKYGPLFDMAWSGRDDEENMYTISRTVLYVEDFEAFVFYDNIQSSQLLDVNVNFNLDPQVKVKSTKDNLIEIEGKDSNIDLWFNKGTIDYTTYEMSKIYNQKLKHIRITNSIEMDKKTTGAITVLSLNDDLDISAVEAHQSNKETPSDYVEGVKLTRKEKLVELYFLNQDVVSGDKLFKTKSGHGFYGKVNILNEQNNFVQIK